MLRPPCFQLPAAAKRLSDDLTKSPVLVGRRRHKDKRLNFANVRFPIGKAIIRDMGFLNFTNDERMASHVQDVDDLTFQVERALLNKRGAAQSAVKHLKPAGFYLIDFRTGCDAAVVRFLHQVGRRHVNGKSHVLRDAPVGVAVVIDGYGEHWGLTAGNTTPGSRHKVWLTVDICPDQERGHGVGQRLRTH